MQEKVLAIPELVTQLKDNKYKLFNYNLTKGSAKAVAKCLNLNSEFLSSINFSNNLLRDEHFALILQSLSESSHINSLKHLICTCKNSFG